MKQDAVSDGYGFLRFHSNISGFMRVRRQLYMRPIPPFGWILGRFFASRARKAFRKIKDGSNAVDFAFGFRLIPSLSSVVTIRPFQVRDEILQLLELLSQLRGKYVLEIGTANGGTLFLFARVASLDAEIVSVDLPGGPFGGGYPEWKKPFYLSFARANQRIHLLREDSHDPRTLHKVKSILRDKELDFLFIDGDHSYEGVKMDFEMYSPLVRKGGIIAFHDIVEHPPETGCHVNRFWNEVKQRYSHMEIVKDWNQRWAGIGVLFV